MNAVKGRWYATVRNKKPPSRFELKREGGFFNEPTPVYSILNVPYSVNTGKSSFPLNTPATPA